MAGLSSTSPPGRRPSIYLLTNVRGSVRDGCNEWMGGPGFGVGRSEWSSSHHDADATVMMPSEGNMIIIFIPEKWKQPRVGRI